LVTGKTCYYKDMLHVPWKSTIELSASQAAVVMRIGAPSDRDTGFAHNSLCDVYMYNYDTFDASRLLMGIGWGRPGEWWAQLQAVRRGAPRDRLSGLCLGRTRVSGLSGSTPPPNR
jgi:hypothetical protein